MGWVDAHLEEPTDTVCTLADTDYALAGAKYIHEASGDWSLASSNRLQHRGRSEESYQVSVQIVASCGGGADVTLRIGTWDHATQGVTMHDDFDATSSIATSSVRPIMLTGILTLAAGLSEIELFVRSATAGRTVTVHSLTLDLVQAG